MLYACGSNGNGQLGTGSYDDADTWVPVEFGSNGPIDLSGGGNHTVIVECDTGAAFTTVCAMFREVVHPQHRKWSMSSSGWDFSYLVDESNTVWKSTFPLQLEPLEFEFGAQIRAIRSGMKHTAVCLENGKMFGWGASRRGQCGIASPEVESPHEFPLKNDAIMIACGRDYTVAAVRAGGHDSVIQSWGASNKFTDLDTTKPTSVHRLLSGWSHIMVNNTMYGSNFHQQLNVPLNNADSVSLGSEHGICVKNNTVYTWGWGEHGNCPGPSDFDGPIQVFGGCATSFVYVQ